MAFLSFKNYRKRFLFLGYKLVIEDEPSISDYVKFKAVSLDSGLTTKCIMVKRKSNYLSETGANLECLLRQIESMSILSEDDLIERDKQNGVFNEKV